MINKDRLQMYVSLTKITIVLCWISLFSFWAIKLFGGNWFEIMVENENFVKFSDIVQNTWLLYLSNFITTFIANYFSFCAMLEKFKPNKLHIILILISTISMWAVANFVTIEFVRMYFGYLIIVLYAFIFQKKWKKAYGLLVLVLETLFIGISMVTRNIELNILFDYLTFLILSIDLYIMYALYYLYVNLIRLKKEKI